MNNKKIVVVCGGNSKEREISLKSGRAVFKALSALYKNVDIVECYKPKSCIYSLLEKKPDLVFITLHGGFGENGELQAVLDLYDIKYIGSNSRTSAICMDKYATKSILHYSNIPTAKGVLVTDLKHVKNVDFFPVCVKPNFEGSSIGVRFAYSMNELYNIEDLLKEFGTLLVEQKLDGLEITVGIIHSKTLPVIHIKPKKGFYDYNNKYAVGATEYIVPADIEKDLLKKCESVALDVYNILHCKGFSRIDMILKDDIPYVLEANTIPGMTETSLLPKAAKAININFDEMIRFIVEGNVRL